MRGALHLLLMIAVFCCGLHVAEPVQAHGEEVHHRLEHRTDSAEKGPSKIAEEAPPAGHHHCPVAPDQSPAPAACVMMPGALRLVAAPAVQLARYRRLRRWSRPPPEPRSPQAFRPLVPDEFRSFDQCPLLCA
jgi:hypothetical protein